MLYLKTFGGLSVDTGGAPGTGAGQQRKRLALLALLAATGPRGMSRDKLIAFLWPDSDAEHGRNLLKQACFALRRDLHARALLLGTLELRLNPAIITSDVQRFEELLTQGDAAEAVAVYAGPFLDGFYLSNAGEFEHWVEDERARWTKRVCETLESLAAQAQAIGDVRGCARWWRRLGELDRLSSHVACGVMNALAAAGDRAAALQFGTVHANLVRQSLGTAPDATVTELLQHLRAAGTEPASLAAPSSRPLLPPAHARRFQKRLVLAAAALLLVGGVVIASGRRAVSPDPHLVAVAPFDLLDAQVSLSPARLVQELSRNLDGVGPYRTVAPITVRERWGGGADRASAIDLGRRIGAGVVLVGQISEARPDSVRLRLTVVNARAGNIVTELDRTVPQRHANRLPDSLTLDVIRALAPTAGIPLRLLSVGTRSLPALKAFIRGEHYFRRFALDSAVASYERAVTLDTGFAVAFHAAGLARAWNFQAGAMYFARADSLNRGVSARDSLLIASDAPGAVPNPSQFHALAARRFAILQDATGRYPEDPEAWYALGDHRFHNGFAVWWNTWNDARAAFDRAIALDSSYAVAYIHPVEIALNDNDATSALRYVRGYMAIPSVDQEVSAMRLLSLLLDPYQRRSRDFDEELERASIGTLRRLAFAVRNWPDSAEAQVAVARRLFAAAEATTPDGSPGGEYGLRPFRSFLAHALIFRGHLREARGVVGHRFVMPAFMELAELGAIPPESVETAIARWLRYPHHPDYQGDHVLFPWLMEAPCYRTMDVAWWWATRRDTASLRRLVRREDSLAWTGRFASLAPWARPVPHFARAALAMSVGDTAGAALTSLWLPADSICDSRPHGQALFRVLSSIGREREATTVFDWRHDRWVPWVLERARLAERLGDRPTALKYYRFVAQAWMNADAELQPIVADARRALTRVGSDPP